MSKLSLGPNIAVWALLFEDGSYLGHSEGCRGLIIQPARTGVRGQHLRPRGRARCEKCSRFVGIKVMREIERSLKTGILGLESYSGSADGQLHRIFPYEHPSNPRKQPDQPEEPEQSLPDLAEEEVSPRKGFAKVRDVRTGRAPLGWVHEILTNSAEGKTARSREDRERDLARIDAATQRLQAEGTGRTSSAASASGDLAGFADDGHVQKGIDYAAGAERTGRTSSYVVSTHLFTGTIPTKDITPKALEDLQKAVATLERMGWHEVSDLNLLIARAVNQSSKERVREAHKRRLHLPRGY